MGAIRTALFALFDRLGLSKTSPPSVLPANTLNGYSPTYIQYSSNILHHEVAIQAISTIAQEISKVSIVHARDQENLENLQVNTPLQRVFDNPNPWMTRADYLEKIVYSLLSTNNAFIIPTWVERRATSGSIVRRYTGLYPISPRNVWIVQDETTSELFIQFRFQSGFETTYRYADVIHIREEYSLNDYMGGDIFGNPNHASLRKTLKLNDDLLAGIAKSVSGAYGINGIIKYNTMLDDGAIAEKIKAFENQLEVSASSIIGLDFKSEFQQLHRDPRLVDPATLSFVDQKILRSWGVSVNILNGDFTTEQYEAFYARAIEHRLIRIQQAHTKALFSLAERSRGHRVELRLENMNFMTNNQKLQLLHILGQSGTIYENEKRELFGLPPVAELHNIRMASLNYVNANFVAAYDQQHLEDHADLPTVSSENI